MRAVLFSAVLPVLASLASCGVGACSRSAPPAPPPPVAKEDGAKPTLILAAKVEARPAPPQVVAQPAPPPLTGKTVLHVGDSMVGGAQGLNRALEAKFSEEGAKLIRDYKVSESIVSFDKSSKLKDLIGRYDPAIVIITLGANDALVPYPQALAPNVQSIVKRIGARECYWIGPPMWKPDTGIVSVLKENMGASCKFYDSSPLELPRVSDGIHPTDKGGAKWADHFWSFFRGADAGAP